MAMHASIQLPFQLICHFAGIEGVPLEFCDLDGQTLEGAPPLERTGPCALLLRKDGYAEECVRDHSEAATIARELRRPYIFHCHLRLAGWAVPVIRDNEPLPAAIICGGALLTEPDNALISHLRGAAPTHALDPEALARALDSTPVIPRDRFRTLADFIYRLTSALLSRDPDAAEKAQAPPRPSAPHEGGQSSLVFPPARRTETRKARRERARELARQNAESEIVRFLRERRPDDALHALAHLLGTERAAYPGASLGVTETFARLLRNLAGGERVPAALHARQSRLIEEILSEKKLTPEALDKACREFISVAEELSGEPRPRQVKAIQKYLERNLSRKLTLGTVSTRFRMGEKPLNALMRKHFGMSLTEYVAALRVAEASRLLETTDLSIGRIARQTGFGDQSYLTKVFKSHLGLTPTEFRERG